MLSTSNRRWDSAGRVLRVAVSLLLISSAALKFDDLFYGQASALLWLPSPRWVFVAIEVEVVVGLWLLSAWQARCARVATFGLFILLAIVSFGLMLSGQSSCGCFGRVSTEVSPGVVF